MNNMYFGQQQYPYMGYQGQPYFGYVAQPQQPITFNNPLTKEDEQLLKNKSNALQFVISDLEMAKSICTHKDNGRVTIVPAGDDKVTCTKCGETFTLTQGDQQAVEAACELMVNILQTLKTYWLSVPTEVARNLYPIIPLIQRIPNVYNIAMRDFNKLFNVNNLTEVNGMQGFNMFNNIVGGGYGYNPMMGGYMQQQYMQAQPQMVQQQPMYQGMQAPMMGGYPMQQPQMMAPNAVMMPQQMQQAPVYQDPNLGVNPFGYNVPSPAPQMQQAQPQMVQQPTQQTAVQQQPAPTANGVPAPAPDAVNDKVFNL